MELRIIIAILLVAFALHSDAGAWTHGVAQGGDLLTDSGFSPPNTILTTDGGDTLLAQ